MLVISFGLEIAENKNQICIWLPQAIQRPCYQLIVPFVCQISYLPSYLCQPSDYEGGGFLSRVIDRTQAVGSDLHK